MLVDPDPGTFVEIKEDTNATLSKVSRADKDPTAEATVELMLAESNTWPLGGLVESEVSESHAVLSVPEPPIRTTAVGFASTAIPRLEPLTVREVEAVRGTLVAMTSATKAFSKDIELVKVAMRLLELFVS